MTTPELTQRAVVRSIVRCIEERGFPPTVGELADEFGVSKPSIHARLHRLAKAGHIEIERKVARGIRVVSVPE